MYSLKQFRWGIRNPRAATSELQRLAYDFYFTHIREHKGIDFMIQDWDNLLLLDGCRYDLFKETNTLNGKLSSVQSPASETHNFLQKTVAGQSFPDTVYLTANPQITKIPTQFHDIHYLWDPLWDTKLNTVPPDRLVDYVLDVIDKYPEKRIFVHFIQPHIPFIGETGCRIDQSPFQGGVMTNRVNDNASIWSLLQDGELTEETVWVAYRENLELAIKEVERLLSGLNGKTVITADHGNGMGEWNVYGHPQNRHIKSLTTVPWFECPTDSRKPITDGKVTSTREMDTSENVTDRLRHLGYAE